MLNSMLGQGKITKAEHTAALATPVTPKVTPARQGCAYSPTAPYFCDYVLHLLLTILPMARMPPSVKRRFSAAA